MVEDAERPRDEHQLLLLGQRQVPRWSAGSVL